MDYALCDVMDNVLFKTPKHVTHDSQWIFPGLSNQPVCFGCAIEMLEEKNIVNVQKKQIVRELLQIFLRDNKILKLMVSKTEVFLRAWNILFTIMLQNQDQHLSELACECCIITLKGTNSDLSVGNVIDNLMRQSKAFENASLVKLLKSIISQYPRVLETLCDDNATFIISIVNFLESSPEESSKAAWDLLTSVLTHLHQFQGVNIPSVILERIIVLCVTTIAEKNLDVEILICFYAFVNLPNSCDMLHHYESSNLTTPSKSVLNFLKKMLMCSNIDSQIVAIKCIAVIADNKNGIDPGFASLQNLCLDRGIAEYLLELLSSSSSKLVQELFNCLQIVVQCKKFYTLGHVVYGFPAIINAVSNLTNYEPLYNGLHLIDILIKNSKMFEKQNLVSQQLTNLNELLKKSLTDFISEGKIKQVVLSCFLSLLQCGNRISIDCFEMMLDIIESFFIYIESKLTTATKLSPWHTELLNSCYEAAFLISKALFGLTNNTSDDTKSASQTEEASLINTLYYLCDRYFVPQAILRLSTRKNFIQETFFETVLLFIETIPERGKMLASKLCHSAFIATVYDSKVLAFHVDPSLEEMFGKILFNLCMSIEQKNIQTVFESKSLLSQLIKFNIPIHDWKSLLEPSTHSINESIDHRTAMFTLIACSHMAECPLISLQQLQPHIEKFASNDQSLSQLSLLGKRYFLYICCQVQMATTITKTAIAATTRIFSKSNNGVISLLSESTLEASILFNVSEVFLVWLLQLPTPFEFMTICLELFFSTSRTDPNAMLEKLRDILHAKDVIFPFIHLCVSTTGRNIEELVINNIMECLDFLLPYLTTEKITNLKQQINRQLLLTDQDNRENSAYLIRCLNTLEVLTEDYIADEDLKLLYRISSFIDKQHQQTCQLEALNFTYLILTKSRLVCDSKPILLFATLSKVTSFFEKTFFSNDDILMNLKISLLSERLSATIVLTTSELIGCLKQFCQLPSLKMNVSKKIIIEGLACADLPVLQLAMLIFWTQVFETNTKSPLLQFVDNTRNVSELNSKDIHLVTIAIHGLILNRDIIVQNSATKCFASLVNFYHFKEPRFLKSQWNQNVWAIAWRKLSLDDFEIPTLSLLHTFMVLSDMRNSLLFNYVLNIVEKCSPTDKSCEKDVMVLSIVSTLLKYSLNDLEYTTLRRLKSALKAFRKKFSDISISNDVRLKYMDVNGVVVLSYGFKIDRSMVTKIMEKIVQRMDEIDDDQTDSGGEETMD